jgi:hypothetical protein
VDEGAEAAVGFCLAEYLAGEGAISPSPKKR